MTPISRIRKRDGRIVSFDQSKITEAIWKAAQSVGGTNKDIAEKIANQVSTVLEVFFKDENIVPAVEQIQDLVEKILIENGHAKTAKAYILYREKHNQLRELKNKLAHLALDNQGVTIGIDLPSGTQLQTVKDICILAYKLGSHSITVKGSKELKFLRQQNLHHQKAAQEEHITKQQSELPFQEDKELASRGILGLRKEGTSRDLTPKYDQSLATPESRTFELKPQILEKKLEEIIPPPIQNTEKVIQSTPLARRSELVEIPMISSL